MIPASLGRVPLVSLLLALVAGGVFVSGSPAAGKPAAAAAQASKRSVWDGVFSDEQAERGRQMVARKCGYCHGDDLGGGDDPPGPALKGRNFLDEWYGKTVADLFARISETMPHDAPGSLSGGDYADVLSFILRENGFPAGSKVLPTRAPELDIVLSRKPQG